jgi:hypothetical protein
MTKLNFEDIFLNSFNTYKVFDDLTVEQVNLAALNTPKTVWQILNHLIIWQQDQLNTLNGLNNPQNINETETWDDNHATEQDSVDTVVAIFKNQIKAIKEVMTS